MKNGDLKRFYEYDENENKAFGFVRYDKNGVIPGYPSGLSVENITDLTHEQCVKLNCGDIVTMNQKGNKRLYTVSSKTETRMSLVYCDHEDIEEVYYEKDGDAWVYVTTVNNHLSGEITTKYCLRYALNSQANPNDADRLPSSVLANSGTYVDIDFTTYPRPAQEGNSFIGWSTNPDATVAEYTSSGTSSVELVNNMTLYPIYSSQEPVVTNTLKIVNNSSDTVEIYYEIDKEEYGNTFISGGSTQDITITQFGWDTPYYIRYDSDGSSNTHTFNGVYQGITETNLSLNYYDGNILPPNESKTDTRWVFYDGDNGILTIASPSGPQCTLSYALGSYADSHDEDKLPQSVTASEGSTVNVDFSTYPAAAAEGYEFVGWSTADGQTEPEYSESGTTTITLYNDVTLYPVYTAHVATDYLAIDNTYGSSNILVEWYDDDKATWKTSIEVTAYEYEDFEYTPYRSYRISFSDGSYRDCVFTGELGGQSYVNASCVDAGSGIISAPDNYNWEFESGVYYLTVQQPSFENKIRIVNNSNDTVEIYYEEDKSEYGNTFINSGSSETINIDAQYPYYLRYDHAGSTNSHTFNGTYRGSSFDGSIGYYDGNIQPPNAVGSDTEWSFTSGDGGTLTITHSR